MLDEPCSSVRFNQEVSLIAESTVCANLRSLRKCHIGTSETTQWVYETKGR